MIIIIEVLITVIVVLLFTKIYKDKKGKKLKRSIVFLIALELLLFISIPATFALANPRLEIQDVVEIEVNSNKQIEMPKTSYLCHDVSANVKMIGDIDYNAVGDYEIEYEVPMLFGKYYEKHTIRVVDKTPPEIVLTGEEIVNLSYTKEYEETGVIATDNYDGDITDKINIEKKEISENKIEIKYTVSDNAGNLSTKTRIVNFIDDIAPVLTLNGKEKISVIRGNSYKEQGAKAVDEKDGDLTEKIQIEGNVDTSKNGTYTVTYKVYDSKGNETIKKRTVSVINQPVQAKTGKNGQKGVIYLTFDDGPSTSITPKILDILKKKNVKATFFILNYDGAKEEIVKREVNEGHTVAIHGYSHNYKEIYKSEEIYMQNIRKLQDKIKKSTGYNAKITRFPGGSSNIVSRYNPGIMSRLTKTVLDNGYKYFDWNVSSGDAGEAKSSSDVYYNVVSNLSKSRSNVVLMHDFNGNTKTLNALEDIIDYGISNGYTFGKITESTAMVTHSVNN